MTQYVVAALYKFAPLDDLEHMRNRIKLTCKRQGIKGILLLAPEGINGTIAGSREAIDAILEHLRSYPELTDLEHKESFSDDPPFHRLKVRLKKEIVTLRAEGVDPTKDVGTYIPPEEWNDLISDPDVITIDTRNDYEVGIGTFKGAVNPATDTFTELPAWVEDNRDTLKDKKIAMFCTGGIRCEKSTALMKNMGFKDVYHLKGGILKYLEHIPEEESLWEGECFVFDQRVAVKHGLGQGSYDMCFGCRFPISESDKQSALYVKGVCCPHCYDVLTDEKKAAAAERQKQIELAKARGETHIGGKD